MNGVFKIVSAFAASAVDGGVRALLGLAGALSVVVGLLCLREPMQTVVVLGLLLGAWWVVSGLIDIFAAVLGDVREKTWHIVMGVVSVLAGGFLLVNPELSLAALRDRGGRLAVRYGAIAVIAGFRMRSLSSAHARRRAGTCGGLNGRAPDAPPARRRGAGHLLAGLRRLRQRRPRRRVPPTAPIGIGFLGVSLAFGLTVLTMAYAVGHISGGHFNPAVTLGLARGGRFAWRDVLPYVVAQVVGAHRRGGACSAVDRLRHGPASTARPAASPPTATATTRRAATRCSAASSSRSS